MTRLALAAVLLALGAAAYVALDRYLEPAPTAREEIEGAIKAARKAWCNDPWHRPADGSCDE